MAHPTEHDVQRTLARSQERWQSYLHKAKLLPELPPAALKPDNLLRKVPAFPDGYHLNLITSPTSLSVNGQATWEFEPQGGCNLEKSTAMRPLTIGVSQPTICTATGSSFRDWASDGTENDEPRNSNFVAVLVLMWAYIFSKAHIEKQDGLMRYSYTSAPIVHDGLDRAEDTHTSVTVDVGEVDGDECRWWRAVLAPGLGWHATVASTAYLSPWSVCYQGIPEFKIQLSATALPAESSKPASCDDAFRYLSRFCARHSLKSQSFAALAATLTLPLHNSLRRAVQLPLPRLVPARRSSSAQQMPYQERHNLPYYMTLSSTPSILGSVIWGSFWEADVDCNVVSAWFQPILKTLTPLVRYEDHELLLKVLALHRPMLAPLWLGAILTGLTSFIIPFLKSLDAPYARPDSVAAAWTGSPQSFMDQPGTGPYIQGNEAAMWGTYEQSTALEIQRIDRWRLLHDIGKPPYNSTPLIPWPPFGRMPLASCELEIRQHECCRRHLKHYSHWNWITTDGPSPEDFGFIGMPSNNLPGIEPASRTLETADPPWRHDIDETASITATRNIFAWNSVNGEGYGPSEKPIFEHEWLEGLLEDDTDDEPSAASLDYEAPDDFTSLRIQQYIHESSEGRVSNEEL